MVAQIGDLGPRWLSTIAKMAYLTIIVFQNEIDSTPKGSKHWLNQYSYKSSLQIMPQNKAISRNKCAILSYVNIISISVCIKTVNESVVKTNRDTSSGYEQVFC